MGRASQEVIVRSPSNGHVVPSLSEQQISPFPVLHVANGRSIGLEKPELALLLQVPIAGKKEPLREPEKKPAPEIPDSQGSFYRLLRTEALQSEGRAEFLRGAMLVENVVFVVPERTPNQIPLQPVHESAVYPHVVDATLEAERRIINYVKTENQLLIEGKNGSEIGRMFGVGEKVRRELHDYPDIARYALKVLGINTSIFDKADTEARTRILNGRYIRAAKAVETAEETARITLAMDIAGSFYGLPRKNRVR